MLFTFKAAGVDFVFGPDWVVSLIDFASSEMATFGSDAICSAKVPRASRLRRIAPRDHSSPRGSADVVEPAGEPPWLQIQSSSDPLQVVDGHIPLTALGAADEGSIQAAEAARLILAVTLSLSQTPQVGRQYVAQWAGVGSFHPTNERVGRR
jgi:hypothetical protein